MVLFLCFSTIALVAQDTRLRSPHLNQVQTVRAVIDANDDDFKDKVIVSRNGGSAGNVLINDLLNGSSITSGLIQQVTLSITYADGMEGIAFDSNGNLIIPAGVSPGLYVIIYQVCESASPGNCDAANVFVLISESELVVPEGISPQGDGKNEKWIIKGLSGYPGHEVMVFDRRGGMVFRAAPYNNDWEGRMAGSDNRLPAGTYLWVINLGNGERKTGSLYIVR